MRAASLCARSLGPYAYRPVELLEELGLMPVGGGLSGAGDPPPDPSRLVVLLDSAGGNPRLARRSLLAWDPVAHLWAKDGRVVLSRSDAAAGAAAAESTANVATDHPADFSPPGRWERTETRGDPFTALRRLLVEAKRPIQWLGTETDDLEWVGAYGLVTYDACRYIEELPATTTDDLHIPDMDIIFPSRWVCFDHEHDRVIAVAESPFELEHIEKILSKAARAPRVHLDLDVEGHSREESLKTGSNVTREQYEDVVARTREYVWAGDIFQANLTQRLHLSYRGESALLYRVLRAVNPSPFAGYLRLSGYELHSSSPERLVRLRGRVADARPIAGTRRRGRDFTEDGLLADDLNLDPKERAEHIMLVDLERNDLGRVCEYGSVHVDELMVNERYSHVIHIVSNVTGMLGAGRDAVDLLRAMFPGGTITGCPKVRCMEIIDELETVRRGPYTGSFGFFGYGGNMDTNIVIRTLVRVGDQVYAQAGGGIVADSVPATEYLESLSKAEAMVRAALEARRLSESG
ncbi:MAG: anthranilate synthase component I family protein [Thermoleophilia bacterium]